MSTVEKKGMHRRELSNPHLEVVVKLVRGTEVDLRCRAAKEGRVLIVAAWGSVGVGSVGGSGTIASTGRSVRRAGGRSQRKAAEAIGSMGSLEHHGLLHHVLRDLRRIVHVVGGDVAIGRAAVVPGSRLRGHNLPGDATSVGGLADRRQNGTDAIHDTVTGFRIGIVHGGLNDIVGEGITKHLFKLIPGENLIDHVTPSRAIGSAEALFNDVGTELLLGQSRDVACEGSTKGVGETRFGQVKNVLHDIVAEGVLNKSKGVAGDLSDEAGLLSARGMVNAALKHTASMTVSSHGHTVLAHSFIDELGVLSAKPVQTLLDDMIAVEILDQVDHVVLESQDHSFGLLGS